MAVPTTQGKATATEKHGTGATTDRQQQHWVHASSTHLQFSRRNADTKDTKGPVLLSSNDDSTIVMNHSCRRPLLSSICENVHQYRILCNLLDHPPSGETTHAPRTTRQQESSGVEELQSMVQSSDSDDTDEELKSTTSTTTTTSTTSTNTSTTSTTSTVNHATMKPEATQLAETRDAGAGMAATPARFVASTPRLWTQLLHHHSKQVADFKAFRKLLDPESRPSAALFRQMATQGYLTTNSQEGEITAWDETKALWERDAVLQSMLIQPHISDDQRAICYEYLGGTYCERSVCCSPSLASVLCCRSINVKARKDARNRIRRSFLVTAATRFFISGLNRSQWDRDRKLRTKGMGDGGLPLRSLLSLGYGVNGPADVTSKQIATAPVPDLLNLGIYRDRLAGKQRDYDQEGRAQIRDLRSILTAHMTAVVALGMVRTDEPIHPDQLLFGDEKGEVHEAHYVTPITVYFRLTDDNATIARFSLFQMPMFSVSVQVIDDLDVFHRGFSNLITRPQLLLLAFERELTSSAREYGTTLRTALESACGTPVVISLTDHHVRPHSLSLRFTPLCPPAPLLRSNALLLLILVLSHSPLVPSSQDVRVQFKYFCSCGDGRSQQIGAGNMQSNSHYRCWLCTVPSHKYRAHSHATHPSITTTARSRHSLPGTSLLLPRPFVADGWTATYRHWTIRM